MGNPTENSGEMGNFAQLNVSEYLSVNHIPAGFDKAESYIIITDGTTIKAVDGITGRTIKKDTDLGILLNSIITTGNLKIYIKNTGYDFVTANTINIPYPNVVVDSNKASILMSDNNKTIFHVTASDIIIRNLKMKGNQYVTQNILSTAINIEGVSGTNRLSNIAIEGNDMSNFGHTGITSAYVDTFNYNKNNISNINYAAIFSLGDVNGNINDNVIDTVGPNIETGNSYGIVLTRSTSGTWDTRPSTTDTNICRNKISNIPQWEGLDTHGGRRLIFSDNIISNTYSGIAIGMAATFAPKDIIIRHNIMDSGITNGGGVGTGSIYGISLTGVAGVDNATGIIEGNLITNYGNDAYPGYEGAIYLRDTSGVTVTKNILKNSASTGILILNNNTHLYINNNNIIDTWSDLHPDAPNISITGTNNIGILDGNTFITAGGKSATHVNTLGIYNPGATAYGGTNWQLVTGVYTKQ